MTKTNNLHAQKQRRRLFAVTAMMISDFFDTRMVQFLFFCPYTAWFVSNLFGNPDCWFSHDMAQNIQSSRHFLRLQLSWWETWPEVFLFSSLTSQSKKFVVGRLRAMPSWALPSTRESVSCSWTQLGTCGGIKSRGLKFCSLLMGRNRYEPLHEKTNNLDFRPCVCSHRSRLEA